MVTSVGSLRVENALRELVPVAATAKGFLGLGHVVTNVVDQFGADPTGVVDSTTAIQAAAQTGTNVYFPPGTYLVGTAGPVGLRTGTSFWGLPGTVVITVPAAASGSSLAFSGNNITNVNIEGLIFDGNYPAVGSTNSLVSISNADHVVFRSCGFRNTCGIGLAWGLNVNDSGGYDCFSSNTGRYGVQANGSQGVAFADVINGNSNRNFWINGKGKNGGLDLLSITHQNQFTVVNYVGTSTTNILLTSLTTTTTATVTSGSVLPLTSVAGLLVGQTVSATGIPAATLILSISGLNITLNTPITASISSGSTITFSTTLSRGAPIYCAGNVGLIIDGVQSANSTGNGIDCFSNSNLIIANSIIQNCGGGGIQSAAHTGGLISNNICLNNGQTAVTGGPTGAGGWASALATSTNFGGITLGGQGLQQTADLVIAGNTCLDTQVQVATTLVTIAPTSSSGTAAAAQTLTFASAAGLTVGQVVQGQQIAPGTVISALPGGGVVTITPGVNADVATGVSIGFGMVSPTQQYGLYVNPNAHLVLNGLYVDQTNNFGTNDNLNAVAAIGGQISAYSAFKISATLSYIQQTGTAPNQGVAMPITGTGNFALHSLTIGSSAVDLQPSRNTNTQIANAPNSVMVGGANNTIASGALFGVIVGSQGSEISGQDSSLVGGQFGWDKARTGYVVFPSASFFAGIGDRQAGQTTLGAITTSATPVRLCTTNNVGTIGSGANTLLMLNNQLLTAKGIGKAFEPSTGDWATWDVELVLTRGANAAATSLQFISGSGAVTHSSVGAASWTLVFTADTTLGCLSVVGTGAASTTIHWTLDLTCGDIG